MKEIERKDLFCAHIYSGANIYTFVQIHYFDFQNLKNPVFLHLIQFSLYNSTLYLQNIHHDESLKFLVGMQLHRLN